MCCKPKFYRCEVLFVALCCILLLLPFIGEPRLVSVSGSSSASYPGAGSANCWRAISAIVALIALILAILTARTQAQATIFATLAAIHQQLDRENSCRARSYLFDEQFLVAMEKAVQAVVRSYNEQYSTRKAEDFYSKVDHSIDWKKLQVIPKRFGVKEFNDALRREMLYLTGDSKGFSALKAVETTLRDFDLFAVPHSLGVKSATKASNIYKGFIKKTALLILPFVIIQIHLRDEPAYKLDYIKLLRKLDAEENGKCYDIDERKKENHNIEKDLIPLLESYRKKRFR